MTTYSFTLVLDDTETIVLEAWERSWPPLLRSAKYSTHLARSTAAAATESINRTGLPSFRAVSWMPVFELAPKLFWRASSVAGRILRSGAGKRTPSLPAPTSAKGSPGHPVAPRWSTGAIRPPTSCMPPATVAAGVHRGLAIGCLASSWYAGNEVGSLNPFAAIGNDA